MVWVFLVEMMNSCSVNFLHMLSYNFVLYLVLGSLALSSNLRTWNLWVAKAWSKSKLLWAIIWLNRVAMIFSYVMLDIRSISFWKHKNIIKFLDDLKFLSKAICCSHCKPSTYATCYLIELCQIVVTLSEIHFILPWSRSRTHSHYMLCFYTGSKHFTYPSTK